MTALGAAAGKDAAAALRAAADKEAVRTGTLDLGGLVSTFRSHSSPQLAEFGEPAEAALSERDVVHGRGLLQVRSSHREMLPEITLLVRFRREDLTSTTQIPRKACY